MRAVERTPTCSTPGNAATGAPPHVTTMTTLVGPATKAALVQGRGEHETTASTPPNHPNPERRRPDTTPSPPATRTTRIVGNTAEKVAGGCPPITEGRGRGGLTTLPLVLSSHTPFTGRVSDTTDRWGSGTTVTVPSMGHGVSVVPDHITGCCGLLDLLRTDAGRVRVVSGGPWADVLSTRQDPGWCFDPGS